MAAIYDNNERVYMGNKSKMESTFAFLDRSGSKEASLLRNKVNELINDYASCCSQKELNRITGNLKSKVDKQFDEAFFELTVFEFLKKHQHEITVSEEYHSDSNTKTPDFVVRSPDFDKLYVEATVLNEKITVYDIDSEIIRKDIINKVETLKNFGFYIFVDTDANELFYPEPENSFESSIEFMKRLKYWFKTLDHENERKSIDISESKVHYDDYPVFVGYIGNDPFDFVEVKVRAYPMSRDIRSQRTDSHIVVPKSYSVKTHNPGYVLNVCYDKCKKYRDIPFCIALSVPNSIEYSPTSILGDLYGYERLINNGKEVDLSINSSRNKSLYFDRDGRSGNDNLKGVIIFFKASSYPFTPFRTELYINPNISSESLNFINTSNSFLREEDIMKFKIKI